MGNQIDSELLKVQIIADQVKVKIDKGSNMLRTPLLRMEVDGMLRDNQCKNLDLLLQMKADELMTELAKASIRVWPQRPERFFQAIEERLGPLAEIAVTLNSDEVSEFVHVRNNPCVISDHRISVEDFKKNLWRLVFTSSDGPMKGGKERERGSDQNGA